MFWICLCVCVCVCVCVQFVHPCVCGVCATAFVCEHACECLRVCACETGSASCSSMSLSSLYGSDLSLPTRESSSKYEGNQHHMTVLLCMSSASLMHILPCYLFIYLIIIYYISYYLSLYFISTHAAMPKDGNTLQTPLGGILQAWW